MSSLKRGFSFLPMTRFSFWHTNTKRLEKLNFFLLLRKGRNEYCQCYSFKKSLKNIHSVNGNRWHSMGNEFSLWISTILLMIISTFFFLPSPLNEHTFHKIFLFTAWMKRKTFFPAIYADLYEHIFFFLASFSYDFT